MSWDGTKTVLILVSQTHFELEIYHNLFYVLHCRSQKKTFNGTRAHQNYIEEILFAKMDILHKNLQ